MSDPIVVSYSEIDTFRQCPLKHQLAYKLRYRGEQRPGAAHKGTWWHRILEAHYLRLRELQEGALRPRTNRTPPAPGSERESWWMEACRGAVQKVLDELVAEEQDTGLASDLAWMYRNYVAAHRIDSEWRVVDVEVKREVKLGEVEIRELGGGMDPDAPPQWAWRTVEIRLKTRVDLIAESVKTGGRWIWDHKSTGNLTTSINSVDLDDQFGLYQWTEQEAWGIQVLGMVRNETRTKRNQADYPGYTGKYKPQTPEDLNQRLRLDRNTAELEAIRQDALNVVQAAYGGQAVYSSPNIRECGWKCDFEDVHLLHRKGTPLQEAAERMGFVVDMTRH